MFPVPCSQWAGQTFCPDMQEAFATDGEKQQFVAVGQTLATSGNDYHYPMTLVHTRHHLSITCGLLGCVIKHKATLQKWAIFCCLCFFELCDSCSAREIVYCLHLQLFGVKDIDWFVHDVFVWTSKALEVLAAVKDTWCCEEWSLLAPNLLQRVDRQKQTAGPMSPTLPHWRLLRFLCHPLPQSNSWRSQFAAEKGSRCWNAAKLQSIAKLESSLSMVQRVRTLGTTMFGSLFLLPKLRKSHHLLRVWSCWDDKTSKLKLLGMLGASEGRCLTCLKTTSPCINRVPLMPWNVMAGFFLSPCRCHIAICFAQRNRKIQ